MHNKEMATPLLASVARVVTHAKVLHQKKGVQAESAPNGWLWVPKQISNLWGNP